jgi:hypothetical protein
VARLARVLKNVEDIYQDEQGRLHIVYLPAKQKTKPWIKMNRGNVRAVKDHRVHDLFPVVNPGLYEARYKRQQQ